jgi:histidine triad (HIT) family protein
MSSIFTKIINREIPAYIIYEDDYVVSFFDISPLEYGHCLVVPKVEIDYIFDLEQESYAHLFATAKKIAAVLQKNVPCLRIGLAVVGLEVPHAHIHLVPLHNLGSIDFKKNRAQVTVEAFEGLSKIMKLDLEAL